MSQHSDPSSAVVAAVTDAFARAGFDAFPRAPRVLCAVSGGLDSMVLVHVLHTTGVPLRAIHIDHAAHPDSSAWAREVRVRLSALEITTDVVRLEGGDSHGNPEERWREARQRVFAQAVDDDEVLATAHHLNDQAETLLLQLLRGAGPTGLQAMPALRRTPHGYRHLRPLLRLRREELLAYAQGHDLDWTEDPSNSDPRYERNFLRRQVLPALVERRPGVLAAMARSAELMAESVALNQELARADVSMDAQDRSLDWRSLKQRSLARQANAVRFWLQQLGTRMPSRQRLDEALRQWSEADDERLPELAWEAGRVQRYRGRLVFCPPPAEELKTWCAALHRDQWLTLPGQLGQLGLMVASDTVVGQDTVVMQLAPDETEFTVQFRQNGERLRRAAGHHQSLKHWFQEHGVAPLRRGQIPLVFRHHELVAIAGLWVDARWRDSQAVHPGKNNYQLVWRRGERSYAK